jgi:hypothetical protein
VFSRIPLDIIFEGRRIGTTDDGQVLIPPGQHRIQLVSRRFNYRGDVTLSIDPGQMLTHTVSLPSGVLRVRGVTGTELWIEGEHIGTLPLSEVTVPIGTREIVFRHAQYGQRIQTVEVAAGTPANVTLSFGAVAAADAAATLEPSAAPPPPVVGPRLAPLSAPRPPRSDAIK